MLLVAVEVSVRRAELYKPSSSNGGPEHHLLYVTIAHCGANVEIGADRLKDLTMDVHDTSERFRGANVTHFPGLGDQ
jgi:hypothetical protein